MASPRAGAQLTGNFRDFEKSERHRGPDAYLYVAATVRAISILKFAPLDDIDSALGWLDDAAHDNPDLFDSGVPKDAPKLRDIFEKAKDNFLNDLFNRAAGETDCTSKAAHLKAVWKEVDHLGATLTDPTSNPVWKAIKIGPSHLVNPADQCVNAEGQSASPDIVAGAEFQQKLTQLIDDNRRAVRPRILLPMAA